MKPQPYHSKPSPNFLPTFWHQCSVSVTWHQKLATLSIVVFTKPEVATELSEMWLCKWGNSHNFKLNHHTGVVATLPASLLIVSFQHFPWSHWVVRIFSFTSFSISAAAFTHTVRESCKCILTLSQETKFTTSISSLAVQTSGHNVLYLSFIGLTALVQATSYPSTKGSSFAAYRCLSQGVYFGPGPFALVISHQGAFFFLSK